MFLIPFYLFTLYIEIFFNIISFIMQNILEDSKNY